MIVSATRVRASAIGRPEDRVIVRMDHSGIIHTRLMVTKNEQWPSLPYDAWKDTYATLHMWTQIVGKIALAQAPPVNHSWAIPCWSRREGWPRSAAARRSLVHDGVRFRRPPADHADVGRPVQHVEAGAAFGRGLLPRAHGDADAMGLPVKIWPIAVEIPVPIRLDTDEVHHTYDAA